jgi:hypothetical protein
MRSLLLGLCLVCLSALSWAASADDMRAAMAAQGNGYLFVHRFVSVHGKPVEIRTAVGQYKQMGYRVKITDAGELELRNDSGTLTGHDATLKVAQAISSKGYARALNKRIATDDHYEFTYTYYPNYPSREDGVKMPVTIRQLRNAGYRLEFEDSGRPVFHTRSGEVITGGKPWVMLITDTWMNVNKAKASKRKKMRGQISRMAENLGRDVSSAGAGRGSAAGQWSLARRNGRPEMGGMTPTAGSGPLGGSHGTLPGSSSAVRGGTSRLGSGPSGPRRGGRSSGLIASAQGGRSSGRKAPPAPQGIDRAVGAGSAGAGVSGVGGGAGARSMPGAGPEDPSGKPLGAGGDWWQEFQARVDGKMPAVLKGRWLWVLVFIVFVVVGYISGRRR